MIERKRVILHIGFHKTGTSALQVFFSNAAEELAVAGIDYPYPEPASNLSAGLAVGNLPILIRVFGGDEIFDQEQAKDFQDRFTRKVASGICHLIEESPFETVLISGELFPLIASDRLEAFLTQLQSRHDPELLCLVRDPFDFVLSMWKQQVRSMLYTHDFETFVDDVLAGRQQASMLTSFDAMADLDVPMTVLRYERLGKDIVGGVLQAMGMAEPELLAFERPAASVNASMSASRAALAVELLQETGDPDLTDVLVKTLARRFGGPSAPEPYDPGLHARLLAHFSRTIERINAHLPQQDALATDIRADVVRPLQVSEDDRHIARVILAELAQRPSGLTGRDLHPDLPIGFDPAVYLLRNPDIAAAGVDPVSHFLTAGQREHRPWRMRRDKDGVGAPILAERSETGVAGEAG